MDCLYVGRLSRRAGTVWRYTAIDVASAYAWAEIHSTARNPEARWTTPLARRVASNLQRFGWKLETVPTDHGGEFGSDFFTPTVTGLGVRHRRIRSGRPQTNGCVERLHQTILEECWKPAFARYYQIGQRGLEADLRHYIAEYNHERAHTPADGRKAEQRLK